jgi:hypothetical protein
MDDTNKIRKIIKTTLNELLNEQITICDLNSKYVKNHYDEELFGHFTEEGMNKNLSKCLCKNNEIIGCYLLNKQSMLETIKYILYYIKENTYKDLKWFIKKDDLNKYKNKRGVFGKFLYIGDEYRNNNYGNILIDYSKTLGDYVWGITAKGKMDKYWLKKQNRIKICEWMEQDGSISLLTATKI